MEGLRGLAVLLVFMVHYEALFQPVIAPGPIAGLIADFLATVGHSGVDLFFLLSGYLIYGSAIKPNLVFWNFIRRRAVRIYPTFLVILAIYLVLFQIFPGKSKLPADPQQAVSVIFANILLLPGMFNIPVLVTVAWSLSYEFFFYLLMPVLAGVTGMGQWSRGSRVALIIGISVAFYISCWTGIFRHPRLLMFSAGALLYETKSYAPILVRLSRKGEPFAAVVFLVGIALSGIPASPLLSKSRILPLFASMWLLTLFSFHFSGWLKTIFSYTPLRYWGNISYSYYLSHGLILHGLAMLYTRLPAGVQLQGSAAFWLFAPIALAITILGSAVLFLLVEKPLSLSEPKVDRAVKISGGIRKADYGA